MGAQQGALHLTARLSERRSFEPAYTVMPVTGVPRCAWYGTPALGASAKCGPSLAMPVQHLCNPGVSHVLASHQQPATDLNRPGACSTGMHEQRQLRPYASGNSRLRIHAKHLAANDCRQRSALQRGKPLHICLRVACQIKSHEALELRQLRALPKRICIPLLLQIGRVPIRGWPHMETSVAASTTLFCCAAFCACMQAQ